MRFASFEINGRSGFGPIEGDRIRDISSEAGGIYADLKSFLAAGNVLPADSAKAPTYSLDEISFLPVIPHPDHIFCLALNYMDHVTEVNAGGLKREAPSHPAVFLRVCASVTGHQQPLIRPKVSQSFDFEAELAVIIGKSGRHISRENAMSHVAGYSCFNDGSIRDWQFHTRQITAGKNFYHSGSLGPWMVTADEIADPGDLKIRFLLNGKAEQDGSTKDMLFSIPAFIEYVSTILPLEPGDVLATGTPAGVGWSRKPPLFMKPGDVAEVEIERVGTLRNVVAQE